MNALNSAKNIRHNPAICQYDNRSRRAAIGLQVPRQPSATVLKMHDFKKKC
jgi:hypothetical protein